MSVLLGFSRATPPRARPNPQCRRRRWIVSRIAASAALLATAVGSGAAAKILRLRCTNPASGASWPIVIDLARSRVDSLPATITGKWISWHDPKQGYFDFDRAAGKLQLRNASSTGGYFLHYTCRPQ
jgi:hypothetical protein